MPNPQHYMPVGENISTPRPPTLFKKLRRSAVIFILNLIASLVIIAAITVLHAGFIVATGLIPIVLCTFITTGALPSLRAYSTVGALGALAHTLLFTPLSVLLALAGAWGHDQPGWTPSVSTRLAVLVATPVVPALRTGESPFAGNFVWGPFVIMLGVDAMHYYGLRAPRGAVFVAIIGGTLRALGLVFAYAGDARYEFFGTCACVSEAEERDADGKVVAVRRVYAYDPPRLLFGEQLLPWLDRAFFALAGLDGQNCSVQAAQCR